MLKMILGEKRLFTDFSDLELFYCYTFIFMYIVILSISSSSVEVDVTNRQEMLKIVKSAIGTKFIRKWSDMACDMAMSAVETVVLEKGDRKEIDIKRYVRIEKVIKSFITCDLISVSIDTRCYS